MICFTMVQELWLIKVIWQRWSSLLNSLQQPVPWRYMYDELILSYLAADYYSSKVLFWYTIKWCWLVKSELNTSHGQEIIIICSRIQARLVYGYNQVMEPYMPLPCLLNSSQLFLANNSSVMCVGQKTISSQLWLL